MKTLSDSKILELCRNENSLQSGFNHLVKTYQERVYWHIRRMVYNHDDADDLVQDTFVKVWKNLDSFREDSQLFTWIYRIATNETLSFLKRKKRMQLISLGNFSNNQISRLEDDNFFSGNEIQLKLQKALLTLPDKQRMVFNMKYYDELKYEEMSQILGTSVGALKASYHIAVKKIQKNVAEN